MNAFQHVLNMWSFPENIHVAVYMYTTCSDDQLSSKHTKKAIFTFPMYMATN